MKHCISVIPIRTDHKASDEFVEVEVHEKEDAEDAQTVGRCSPNSNLHIPICVLALRNRPLSSANR